ncbi:hypothetical protein PR048_006637 [Dryococelus australis]|uniref:Uncharacterized protein n=1 Tax=Dryococelus australis TaxID=614101 RepID=A0ABQ9IBI2_9NEOP|nr:hypothetical protein PR048_006637 [Dryococelus australis]
MQVLPLPLQVHSCKGKKAIFKGILLLAVRSLISITHSDVEFPPLARLSFKYVTKYDSLQMVSVCHN